MLHDVCRKPRALAMCVDGSVRSRPGAPLLGHPSLLQYLTSAFPVNLVAANMIDPSAPGS